MRPYEWMTTYTPQKEWIEKRGVFTPLAFYFGSLGGGLYLVSLFYESLAGMVLAWLIVGVLKGSAHLVDLGQPSRSWRMVFRIRSSWISRGLVFVVIFLGVSAVQIFLFLFLAESPWEGIFRVLAGVGAFVICLYPGFTLSYVHAIPLWNSAVLPALFTTCGLLGGMGLLSVAAVFGAGVDSAAVQKGSAWVLGFTALLLLSYGWATAYMGPPGKRALRDMITGQGKVAFWVGIVLLGMVMPFVTALVSKSGTSGVALFLAGTGEVVCGLSVTYAILRCGSYSPLIPGPAMTDPFVRGQGGRAG
jgi:formate-dependent nitrite reductase membrane component NrfD